MSTDTRKTATASKDAHDDLFEYKTRVGVDI